MLTLRPSRLTLTFPVALYAANAIISVEHAFGQFQRAIPVLSGVGLDRTGTRFANGVLILREPSTGETTRTAKQNEIS